MPYTPYTPPKRHCPIHTTPQRTQPSPQKTPTNQRTTPRPTSHTAQHPQHIIHSTPHTPTFLSHTPSIPHRRHTNITPPPPAPTPPLNPNIHSRSISSQPTIHTSLLTPPHTQHSLLPPLYLTPFPHTGNNEYTPLVASPLRIMHTRCPPNQHHTHMQQNNEYRQSLAFPSVTIQLNNKPIQPSHTCAPNTSPTPVSPTHLTPTNTRATTSTCACQTRCNYTTLTLTIPKPPYTPARNTLFTPERSSPLDQTLGPTPILNNPLTTDRTSTPGDKYALSTKNTTNRRLRQLPGDPPQ